ncbi:hypothetical protein CK203_018515 [Vitis vinifera]|uniref:Disease resistance R13L4/SHOC-2-like LRR domain-containing protein n=1 Tax=Vitis vinifera TaxID=29760 RepID=A0A438J5T7_VITVI|nr:hypothetical protein CK203_018515 [Vitis vinifera]
MEDTAENTVKQLDGLGMLQDFDDGSRVKVCRPYWEFSICKVEEQGFATVCVNSLIHLAVAGGDKDRFTWHLCPISVFHGHKNPFGPVGEQWIRELPASIDNLKKLQTLNIRMCGNLKKLPNEVLKHATVEAHEMSRSFDDGQIRVPSGIRILVNLHTFCGLYAGVGIARELSSLTQLRILGIKRICDDHGGELFESIMKMVDLVSSSLEAKTTWFGEEDSRKTALLSSLEPFLRPPLVCELHLHGGLVEFPKWIALMGNLTGYIYRSLIYQRPQLQFFSFFPN